MTAAETPQPPTDATDRLRTALERAGRRLAQVDAAYDVLAGHFAALQVDAIANRTPGFTGLTLDSTNDGDDQGGVFTSFCVTLELDAGADARGLDAAPADPDAPGLLDEDEARDLTGEIVEGWGHALIDTWGPHVTRGELAELAAAAAAYATTLPTVEAAQPDLAEIPWPVVDDLRSSYTLAMKAAGVDEGTASEIERTVADYVVNHYGDIPPAGGEARVDEALSFSPAAIREAFAGVGDDRAAWVAAASYEALRAVGLDALSGEAIYRAFRETLTAVVDDAIAAAG